jgi:ketosteroid isomerase-like protein
MSEENVEVARRGYEAFRRDGLEGLMPFLDEEIEWRNPEDSPIAGVWHGHTGVREWFKQATEAFGEMTFAPDEFREASEDRVLVLLHFGLRGAGSGVQMDVPFAHLIDIKAGHVTALRMYSDQRKALAAAGLSE